MLRKLTKTSRGQQIGLVPEPILGCRPVLPFALTLAGIAALAVVVGSFSAPAPGPVATHQVGSRPSGPSQISSRAALSLVIRRAQERLHIFPADKETWAGLGSAYRQQARITGDPTYYPKAEGALKRSLALEPSTNWEAMTGLGALANARLDFAQALRWARTATAVNPYDSSAYGVMDDALTQLGDYPGASAALQKMLALQPGIPSFTRAASQFEERGDPISARKYLSRALNQATERSDLAFCRYYLGELAFNGGDPKAAFGQYQLGLRTDPSSEPLLAGRAKAEAALGRTAAALNDYATVIDRVPQPQYILEYAELLLSLGRDDEAQRQLDLLAAEQKLLATNGVLNALTTAVVEADHGSATTAVRQAETEWSRRRSVIVADALGWALHRAGRDREALGYATRANRFGGRNAGFRYHLGMIELALDHRAEARRQLGTALKINPYFSVLQAPIARRALAATAVEAPRGRR